MKFSFATAFLAFTAASAVVFAAPTEGTSELTTNGVFAFSGNKIDGKVLGKTILGTFSKKLPVANLVIPAHYSFKKLSDLDGKFTGSIVGGKLSIKYNKGGATITGKASEPHPIVFQGETKVL